MKKWIILAVVLTAGAVAVYLDHAGHIDLRATVKQGEKIVGEVVQSLSKDDAHAATKTADTPERVLAPAVSIATVKPEHFIEEIMVTGSLVAREEILIAPEVESLRVLTLLVEEGDSVEKGQVIATLERETLLAKRAQNDANLRRAEAAIAQAKSRIRETEAVLVEAEAQLARAKPLQQRRILSDAIFDQRRAATSTARAQLATAKDGVLLAQAEKAQIEAQRREVVWNLSKTEIRAPTAGLITRRSARIGDQASGVKTAMFHLAKDGEIELEAAVIEPKLARVNRGQKVTVHVAGAGKVDGEVRLVSPEIDQATRLGRVRVFLGTNPQLRIGAFGRGTIIASRSEGLAVPLSAVLFKDGNAFVHKIVDGKVKSVTVELGLNSNTDVEITAGLKPGDIVVAKSGSFLRDGDAVRPILANQQVSEVR